MLDLQIPPSPPRSFRKVIFTYIQICIIQQLMSSQPYRGIINAENPRSRLPQTSTPEPQRSLQDIQEENQNLRQMIEKLRRQKAAEEARVDQQPEPEGNKAEFNRRYQQNSSRIRQLQNIVNSQQQVIESYREKFKDFEDNLFKIMKLDKDIHHRLVNPQPNPTLETNVRNVLVALNGRAPYDKLIKMIESIRV